MEALAALLGLGVAAAAPFVPGLRPVAKAVVKGGMAVADAAVTVAAAVAEEAGDIAAHLRSGHGGEASGMGAGEAAAQAVDAGAVDMAAQPAAESAAAQTTGGATVVAATSAGLRPVSKVAVKGGLAMADAAKAAAGVAAGAAAVAGKQVGGLAAAMRPGKAAGEAAVAEAGSMEDAVVSADLGRPETEPSVEPVAYGLIDVSGVGPKTATLLHEAGITTVAQLAAARVERLKEILEQAGPRYRIIDPGAWPANAQALLDAPPPQPAPFDDANLVQIEGVGPKTAGLLHDAGITTVSQLAATPVERLRAILDQAGPRYRIVDPTAWPERAQALLPSV